MHTFADRTSADTHRRAGPASPAPVRATVRALAHRAAGGARRAAGAVALRLVAGEAERVLAEARSEAMAITARAREEAAELLAQAATPPAAVSATAIDLADGPAEHPELAGDTDHARLIDEHNKLDLERLGRRWLGR